MKSLGLVWLAAWPAIPALATGPVSRDAYARAEQMLPWNRDRVLLNADVDAFWIPGSERLWYKGGQSSRPGTSSGPRSGAAGSTSIATTAPADSRPS